MAIQYNENIKIAAPSPLDKRYLSERTLLGSPLPYSGVTEVNTVIISTERYTGLTVNIGGVEYWYKEGVTNGNLIEKKYDSIIPSDDFVTGATNIGFFSGQTGVQTLPIDNLSDNNYDGNYDSLYNYYFRGTDGKIHTGEASDGIFRRGYYNIIKNKSWLWNEYLSDALVGWNFVDGNIENEIGQFLSVYGGAVYYNSTTTFPYTATTWTTGNVYNNSSNAVINLVVGSLTTGNTLTIGGPVFAVKDVNHLHFRTLKTDTPDLLKIGYDESFVHLSGKTPTALNIGVGSEVYVPLTSNPLEFKTFVGAGYTTVTQTATNIIISSSASGGTVVGTVTGGTNGISSANINNLKLGGTLNEITNIDGVGTYDLTLTNLNEFQASRSGTTIIGFDSAGILLAQSGGSVTFEDTGGLKYAANYSANYTNRSLVDKEYVNNVTSGSTYNLGSPSVIPVGGICAGTILTGKTAIQLFEELLVPELCGTVTAPSIGIGLSGSGLYEIGCTVSQTVTGTFSRGSISPQYCSVSAFRSGCAISYCFTGTGMPSGFQACASSPASQTNPSYIITIGTQSWGVCTCYGAGNTAQGSKGTVYASALPAGCTSAASSSIVGVYPLFGTTSSISTLTAQALQNMSSANNIQINLVSDSSPNKQKFEIPCAWLGSPTSRPLVGVCQWNTVSSQWEYPGGSAGTSLALWSCSAASETVQGNSIGYCLYTYNGVDRSAVCIRLAF